MHAERNLEIFRFSAVLALSAAVVLSCPGAALALEKCKAGLSSKDGSITVSVQGVTGTLLWGAQAGSETNAFFNAGSCVADGKASKCTLGDVGTPERIVPPPLCTIYLKDDAGTDSCYIKGCVAGAREDLSADLVDLADELSSLSARTDAIESAVDDQAEFHPTLGKIVVFRTSSAYGAAMGGIAGADAICAMHALIGGLSGTYLAWISDGITAPVARMTQSSTPYYLPDGVTVVANDWADLTDGSLAHPIDRDESGRSYGGVGNVWSNVNSAGMVADPVNTCAGFTSGSVMINGKVGQYSRTDSLWTDVPGGPSCNGSAPIYCVQQ